MKKKITTLCLLMFISFGFSQTNDRSVFVEAGINPTTVSSTDVNWVAKAGIDLTSNTGISVFYERYNSEGYISYGVQPSIGWDIDYGFQFSVGTELSIIERPEQFNLGNTNTYMTYGFNAELGYEFTSDVIIYIGGDIKHRPDLGNNEWSISPGTGLRFYIL